MCPGKRDVRGRRKKKRERGDKGGVEVPEVLLRFSSYLGATPSKGDKKEKWGRERKKESAEDFRKFFFYPY